MSNNDRIEGESRVRRRVRRVPSPSAAARAHIARMVKSSAAQGTAGAGSAGSAVSEGVKQGAASSGSAQQVKSAQQGDTVKQVDTAKQGDTTPQVEIVKKSAVRENSRAVSGSASRPVPSPGSRAVSRSVSPPGARTGSSPTSRPVVEIDENLREKRGHAHGEKRTRTGRSARARFRRMRLNRSQQSQEGQSSQGSRDYRKIPQSLPLTRSTEPGQGAHADQGEYAAHSTHADRSAHTTDHEQTSHTTNAAHTTRTPHPERSTHASEHRTDHAAAKTVHEQHEHTTNAAHITRSTHSDHTAQTTTQHEHTTHTAQTTTDTEHSSRAHLETDLRTHTDPLDKLHANLPVSVETSAGGLVLSGLAESITEDGDVDFSRIYVALIGRQDRRGRLLWSMPKGHIEPEESTRGTAEREVWEETGVHGTVIDELGTIDYWFISDGVRIHKTVHHHLLRFVDGELNDEDPEVTEVQWLPMNELESHLAYADERLLAKTAFRKLRDIAHEEAKAGRATPR